jgi:hypothetical protein
MPDDMMLSHSSHFIFTCRGYAYHSFIIVAILRLPTRGQGGVVVKHDTICTAETSIIISIVTEVRIVWAADNDNTLTLGLLLQHYKNMFFVSHEFLYVISMLTPPCFMWSSRCYQTCREMSRDFFALYSYKNNRLNVENVLWFTQS